MQAKGCGPLTLRKGQEAQGPRAIGARGIWACWPFGRVSGPQPLAWIWAWSWDPPRFMRRHPPHHLSPAWAKHPAGPDPEASPKDTAHREKVRRPPSLDTADESERRLASAFASVPLIQKARPCLIASCIANGVPGEATFRQSLHDLTGQWT